MSTRMIQNQRRAYLAQAEDAARVLGYRLRDVSPAEQVVLLASAAKAAGCPVDTVMLTEHRSDALDAAMLADGDLQPGSEGWSWKISSGCELRIVVTQEDQR